MTRKWTRLWYLRVILLVQIALGFSSCGTRPDETKFDADAFSSKDRYNLVLCFDLRDDDRPIAGLSIQGNAKQAILNSGSAATSGASQSSLQHFVILPFESEAVQKNRQLLTMTGSYKDFTLIGYIAYSDKTRTNGVGIAPVFGVQPQHPPEVEDLKESVYVLRSGLERRFIYKYRPSKTIPENWPSELQQIPLDLLDAIAVAIPSDAQGLVIRKNLSAIPQFEFDNDVAKFYPAYSDRTDAKYLEVKYAVQLSTPLKIIGDTAPKIIAAFMIPLLELALLSSEQIFKRKTRRYVLIVGTAVQVLILAILIWLAVSVKGELMEKTIVELTSILLGAVLSAFVFYIKRTPLRNASSPPAPPQEG